MEGIKQHDSLHRFLFEHFPVRGELVHMDASWQAALDRQDYPEPVRRLLGEAMAATVLLASTLKFDGRLTLQIQGDGPVNLLVVQCTSRLVVRGMADWQAAVEDPSLEALVGGGRMAITIEPEGRERYQGIVPLEGDSLARSFEAYFERSEQLPTRLWLAADGDAASGMLLQVMPDEGPSPDSDAWDRATKLADTVTDDELHDLPVEHLLHRLYHEEDVRLFESSPVAFRCSCSRDKIAELIRRLGREEAESILDERGDIEVGCEFCGRQYRFDAVDTEAVLSDSEQPGPSTRH